MKKTIIRSGLETLYFSGMHHWLRPVVGGVGSILTLHHVRPARPDAFQPNRLLEISPQFFERLLRRLNRARIDVVSLDEMHRRFIEGDFKRRFVAITFDDGYKDLKEWAYPVLKKYEMPFALYIATSFPDRLGELWWVALEAVIAQNDRIGLVVDGKQHFFFCHSVREKREVYDALYGYLRSLKTEEQVRKTVRDLCACYKVDMAAFCRDLCMDWSEIAELADDPLCTIGAHTVTHPMLMKVPSDAAVRSEMEMSRSVLEAALGKRPEHLAYPVGDPTSAGPREFRIAAELGFKTAVTTRPGVLFKAHRDHLTALPRISVNGEFQQQRYVKVLMSGAGTALWNGFRRVNAA
ncbi:polysaccharide deacetylase family protein [Microbacteriaceae bacterium K1510]|nr:polysaccharide deacetylase family protein [Microbacteriaceae bacterium K1510]